MNVQPHSGSSANPASLLALLEPGDTWALPGIRAEVLDLLDRFWLYEFL